MFVCFFLDKGQTDKVIPIPPPPNIFYLGWGVGVIIKVVAKMSCITNCPHEQTKYNIKNDR